MGCLTHKEAKKNALLELEKKEFFIAEEGKPNTRKLNLDKQEEFKAYHTNLLKATNDNYGLTLTSLFDTEVKVINDEANAKMERETIIRITPIDKAFEQVDAKRKALGIYEDKVSIGEYNTQMESQRELDQEKELKSLAEMREANQQSGFINEEGDVFPSAEEALNYQEDETDDNLLTIKPGITKTVMQPTYEDYLSQKQNLLKNQKEKKNQIQ